RVTAVGNRRRTLHRPTCRDGHGTLSGNIRLPLYGRSSFAEGTSARGTEGGSDGEDDLAAGVAFFEVPDGVRGFAEGVRAVDDRGELAGLDEVEQVRKVLFALEREQAEQ